MKHSDTESTSHDGRASVYWFIVCLHPDVRGYAVARICFALISYGYLCTCRWFHFMSRLESDSTRQVYLSSGAWKEPLASARWGRSWLHDNQWSSYRALQNTLDQNRILECWSTRIATRWLHPRESPQEAQRCCGSLGQTWIACSVSMWSGWAQHRI